MVTNYSIITLNDDYSITEYGLFITIFRKYINIAIFEHYIFPIMLALCLMILMTYYAQNYAGIIGGSQHTKINVQKYIVQLFK